MKNEMKDYAEELRAALRAYHETEQDLIATSPMLYESDEENYTDSYKWLRLQIPDEHVETVSNALSLGFEDFPNDFLAAVLVEGLRNQVPKEVRMNGVSIDRIGNSFRFCISGSTSLEDLRTLCEQYESHPDFGDEK